MQLITNHNLTQQEKIKVINFLEKNNISFKDLTSYIDFLSLREWANEEITYIFDNSDSKSISFNEWTGLEILQIKL